MSALEFTLSIPVDLVNTTIVLPISGYTSAIVNWGDESSSETVNSSNPSHVYATGGNYVISINKNIGNITNLNYTDGSFQHYLTSCNSFGEVGLTDLSSAFKNAIYLTSVPSTLPTITKILDTNNMFNGAASFNQNINEWDVSKVTNMSYMFSNTSFNSDISNWIVSSVTDMRYMFYKNKPFNQPIGNWNVGNVTNMSCMFAQTDSISSPSDDPIFGLYSAFNQDISSWDVSKVTDMSWMFNYAIYFNKDLSNWKVSLVKNMTSMFNTAYSFNSNISRWDVSNVTNMRMMFRYAKAFNQNIGNWNVSKVTDTTAIFFNAIIFDQDLSSWNVGNASQMVHTFSYSGLSPSNFTNILVLWSLLPSLQRDVELGAGNITYYWTAKQVIQNLKSKYNWKIWGAFLIESGFSLTFNIPSGNTTITLPFTGTNLSSLTYFWGDSHSSANAISHTYSTAGTYIITVVDLSGTSSIDSFGSSSAWGQQYLTACNSFSEYGITDFSYAFYNATNLTSVPTYLPSLKNVVNLSHMFHGATSFNQDISLWYVSFVTDMSFMFCNASSFNGNITSWIVDSVINMSSMFNGATTFNQTISVWNTPSLQNISNMFNGATTFNQNIGLWNITNVTNMTGVLQNSGLSTINYTYILIQWAAQAVKLGLTLDASPTMYYPSAVNPRNTLRNTYGWTINDGGLDSSLTFIFSITQPGKTINLPIPSYTTISINWGDGITNTGITSHIYSSIGTYTVVINGTGITQFGSSLSGWGEEYLLACYSFGLVGLTNLSYAFYNAINLESVPFSLPPSVTNLSNTFNGAVTINQNLNNWDVSTVTNMSNMFQNASLFNGIITGWSVNIVSNMDSMFKNALFFNQNISGWNVSNVTTMNSMFNGAKKFNQNLGTWVITKVTNMSDMFLNSGLSNLSYSNILIGWASQLVQQNVTLNAYPTLYNPNAESSRYELMNTYNWTITDGGLNNINTNFISISNATINTDFTYSYDGSVATINFINTQKVYTLNVNKQGNDVSSDPLIIPTNLVIVGAGGSGGSNGGGGGGGEALVGTKSLSSVNTYNAYVGLGGAPVKYATAGNSGQDSYFNEYDKNGNLLEPLISHGGSGGDRETTNLGGDGGGTSGSGGSGTNKNGSAVELSNGFISYGGGAGGGYYNDYNYRNGGNGAYPNTITPLYGGGGGSARWTSSGGEYGGGNSSLLPYPNNGNPGLPNTGGGASGGCVPGGFDPAPRAFGGSGITSLILQSTLLTYSVTYNTGLTLYFNDIEIPSNKFQNNTSIISVNLIHVTSIGASAFVGCTSMKNIIIPDTVTSIGVNAFAECNSLIFYVINQQNNALIKLINNAGGVYISVKYLRNSVYDPITDTYSNTVVNGVTISNTNILNAAYSAYDLRDVGYRATELFDSGNYSILNLIMGGYLVDELKGIPTVPLDATYIIIRNGTNITYYTGPIQAPQNIGGVFVNVDGIGFAYDITITCVSIGDGITYIPAGAFYMCSNLQLLFIGPSVTSINFAAFYVCYNLTGTINLPYIDFVDTIAFRYCSNIKAINLPKVSRIYDEVFEDCSNLNSMIIGNSLYTFGTPGGGTNLNFSRCPNLIFFAVDQSNTTVINLIKKNCNGLDHGNFVYAQDLFDAIDPVTGIGYIYGVKYDYYSLIYAGYPSNLLKNIGYTLPMLSLFSVSQLANDGFTGNDFYNANYSVASLKDVFADPNYLKEQGYSLANLITGGGLTSTTTTAGGFSVSQLVDAGLLNSDTVYAIVTPDGTVTQFNVNPYSASKSVILNSKTFFKFASIKDTKSYKKSNLLQLNIEINSTKNLKAIDNTTTSISFIDGTLDIIPYAFLDYIALVSAILPDTILTIGSGAFKGCLSLVNVNIPNNLTTISSYLFYECSSLTTLLLPDKIKSIDDYSFAGSGLLNITIPNINTIGQYVFANCINLSSITFDNSVFLEILSDYLFFNCSKLSSINCPQNVTILGNSLFQNCTILNYIEIPNDLVIIGNDTFRGCNSLLYIRLPNSVTSIGTNAFTDCFNLIIYAIDQSNPILPSLITASGGIYTTLDVLKQNIDNGTANTYNDYTLLHAGYSAYDLLAVGYTEQQLIEAGYDAYVVETNPAEIIQNSSFNLSYTNNFSSIPNGTYGLFYLGNLISGTIIVESQPTYTINFNDLVFTTSGNLPISLVEINTSSVFQTFNLTINAICFKEDTQILTDKGYVIVQNLKKGDLVKTLLNDYLPIHTIKCSKIYNSGNQDRIKDRLYRLSKENYPELFEDLILTGGHSILVDKLTEKQNEYVRNHHPYFEGTKVDNEYCLLAYVDEKSIPYEKEGEFNVYHFSLECDDENVNFGIFANGILVETCPKKYINNF
jgi:surface protein